MPESSVEGWLTQLGLGRYTSLFHENQVKAGDLIRLNDDYLKEIGVHSAKHRNQMLAAPKPIIQAKPKNTARSKADLQTSLQILWLYFLAPFCTGLCCFIAEVSFIAVGLPSTQNATAFGITSCLGSFTVLFCLFRTQHNLKTKRTFQQDLVSVGLMFAVYALLLFGILTAFHLENAHRTSLAMSWLVFVGLPLIFLRKLVFKKIGRIFRLSFLMCLIFTTWEILLMGYINRFDFTGTVEEQRLAWSISLLIFIRSLSVFLFYTRAALDIRHLASQKNS